MLKGQVGAAGKDWASSFTDASTAADDNVCSCRCRCAGEGLEGRTFPGQAWVCRTIAVRSRAWPTDGQ